MDREVTEEPAAARAPRASTEGRVDHDDREATTGRQISRGRGDGVGVLLAAAPSPAPSDERAIADAGALMSATVPTVRSVGRMA